MRREIKEVVIVVGKPPNREFVLFVFVRLLFASVGRRD